MRKELLHIILIILCLLGFASTPILAQDVPFSQFYHTNLYLNPALTGAVEKDFRFTANYKNQWKSVSDPFKSTAFNYDMAFYQDIKNEEYIGMGVAYFNDKAGSSMLELNLISLSLAYSLQSDRYNHISMGLIGNYGMRSIDFSDVKWENQHNGNNFDASLPSGETELSGKFNYWDVGAGFNWMYRDANQGIEAKMGLAVYHLNQPDQSFIKEKSERLKRKYQLNSGFTMEFTTFDVLPEVVVSRQGNSFSGMIGGLLKLKPDEVSESIYTNFNILSYLYFGSFYRYRDAVIVSTIYDYKRTIKVGLSYDFTVSKFRKYNNGNGGFEISLIYNGAFDGSKIKMKGNGVKKSEKHNVRKKSPDKM